MTPDDRETRDAEGGGGTAPDEPDSPADSEIWKKINSETEMLRRRTTPIHVQQRILSSLPDTPPKRTGTHLSLSPAIAAGVGIALLIIGMLLGMVLRVQ